MIPRGPKRSIDLLTWVSPANTLLLAPAVSTAPFVPLEYPNPRPKQNNDRGFIGPNRTYLIGQDQFFGAAGERTNFDWQNPQRRKVVTPGFDGASLLQTTLASPATQSPFKQLDWSMPSVRRSAVHQSQQSGSSLCTTLRNTTGNFFLVL